MNMRECSEIDQISRHNKEAKPMNDTPAAERELVDLIVQCEQALDATEGAHGARAPGSGRVSRSSPRSYAREHGTRRISDGPAGRKFRNELRDRLQFYRTNRRPIMSKLDEELALAGLDAKTRRWLSGSRRRAKHREGVGRTSRSRLRRSNMAGCRRPTISSTARCSRVGSSTFSSPTSGTPTPADISRLIASRAGSSPSASMSSRSTPTPLWAVATKTSVRRSCTR